MLLRYLQIIVIINYYPPRKSQSGLDFSYFGGIYRDTYLITTNKIHVSLPELSKTVAGEAFL